MDYVKVLNMDNSQTSLALKHPLFYYFTANVFVIYERNIMLYWILFTELIDLATAQRAVLLFIQCLFILHVLLHVQFAPTLKIHEFGSPAVQRGK